MNIF
ncbi:hypothetical protein MXB_3575 [Myxobolus squamalis]|jgi:hypothetical protein